MNLERHRIDRLSDEEIIGELKEVAKYYDFVKFTRHEFDKVAKNCKGTAVLSRFGSWEEALSKTDKKGDRQKRGQIYFPMMMKQKRGQIYFPMMMR